MATDTQTGLELEPYNTKGAGYTAEQVELALMTLAATAGNSVHAHERLKDQGHNIPRRTLSDWQKTRYPNRYQRACEQHAQHLEGIVLAQARAGAVKAGQLQDQIMDRLASQIDTLEAKDAAAAIQKLAIAKGVDIDKVLILTGRPSNVTEHRTADEALSRLNRLGIIDLPDTAVTDETPQPQAQDEAHSAA